MKKYLLLWLFSAVAGNFIQVECAEGSRVQRGQWQQQTANSNKNKATATAAATLTKQQPLQATKLQALLEQNKTQTIITYAWDRKRRDKKKTLKKKQQKGRKAETNKRQKHARKSREIYWQFSNKCTAQRMSYEMFICISLFVSVSASVAEQLRSCCHAAATKSCFAYFMVLDVLLQLPQLQH